MSADKYKKNERKEDYKIMPETDSVMKLVGMRFEIWEADKHETHECLMGRV